jgi:TPR repeat protein
MTTQAESIMNKSSESEFDALYDIGESNYNEKRFDEALPILMKLADRHYAPAYFLLASYHFYHAEQKDALPWLKLLEAAAADDDADACLRCYHAYRLNWALIGSPETQDIGSAYLRRAAELGHTVAQRILAHEYRSGANGQVKDQSLYLHWITKAVEGGDDDAVYDHVKWLADRKRPIPGELVAKLTVLAEQWSNAAKLLARISPKSKK